MTIREAAPPAGLPIEHAKAQRLFFSVCEVVLDEPGLAAFIRTLAELPDLRPVPQMGTPIDGMEFR
jgi:hypothetical protein